jgi:NAD(P)-dependent dehydrogenase (short-subunit alcohol dehydrogenase family)
MEDQKTASNQLETVAVVTGGAGGIGLGCARRLGRGHRLLLADVSAERLAEAATELESDGATVDTATCDVSDPDSVAALVEQARSLGPVAALGHAAGILFGEGVDAKRIIEVNLGGTMRLLDAFAAPLGETGGAAVLIASIAGHRRFAREYDRLLESADHDGVLAALFEAGVAEMTPRGAYAVAKRGMIVQSELRARAWGEHGARIATISPGLIVDTAMGAGAAAGVSSTFADNSASRRAGTTRDVAAAMAFLSSADAGFVTGCDLIVDGGQHAGANRSFSDPLRAAWHSYPTAD